MFKRNKKNVICSLNIPFVFAMLLIAFCIVLMLQSRGFLVDYSGWKSTTVPTDTPTQATVKIPETWRFVVEDNRVYIKDENDNIVAGELYEAWGRYDDISETSPNDIYSGVLDNYINEEIVCANIDVCTVTEYSFENSENVYILTIPIYYSTENRCHYELKMVVENEHFDSATFLKLVKSYREPSDYIQ